LSSIDQNELLYLKHYYAGVDKFVQMVVRDSLYLNQCYISIVLILHPLAAVAMPEVVSFSNIPKLPVRQLITTIQFAIFNSFLFLTKLSSTDQNELLYQKHYNAGVTSLCKWGEGGGDLPFLYQLSISIALILGSLPYSSCCNHRN
jgi:hypothetical protein